MSAQEDGNAVLAAVREISASVQRLEEDIEAMVTHGPGAGTDERFTILTAIDPTDLRPGDVILGVGDHEESGCHCDVTLAVRRPRSWGG